ncbi:dolichol phosphate mannosyltransferas-like protein subunit 3 [Massariosphaeria phaeospora]|uniref:Dolichol-phosphate mannosyltransferase subunit 3 n=1 Tax=Massariosphaeria phaeospora TaxID=100035 RepID=A0A7C8MLH0_9PLEO|nr:dolichol phosphate mannosyltransferas-like protein subunit 3 [Massariosphaeria phaeospora]
MTRAQQTISIALLLTSLYLAIFTEIVSLPQTIQKEIVPVIPLWALVSFGSYLLFKLGWGVFTFNDVPDAHKEILAQIQQARTELKAKGVDVGED